MDIERTNTEDEVYLQSMPAEASLRSCVCDVVVADVDGLLHTVLAAGPPQDGRRGWVSKLNSHQLQGKNLLWIGISIVPF